MEFALCEIFLETIPIFGYMARKCLLNWPLRMVHEERRQCRRLEALRSERLRALDAQGVDLMAMYRRNNKSCSPGT